MHGLLDQLIYSYNIVVEPKRVIKIMMDSVIIWWGRWQLTQLHLHLDIHQFGGQAFFIWFTMQSLQPLPSVGGQLMIGEATIIIISNRACAWNCNDTTMRFLVSMCIRILCFCLQRCCALHKLQKRVVYADRYVVATSNAWHFHYIKFWQTFVGNPEF